jgi:hypothetical protein
MQERSLATQNPANSLESFPFREWALKELDHVQSWKSATLGREAQENVGRSRGIGFRGGWRDGRPDCARESQASQVLTQPIEKRGTPAHVLLSSSGRRMSATSATAIRRNVRSGYVGSRFARLGSMLSTRPGEMKNGHDRSRALKRGISWRNTYAVGRRHRGASFTRSSLSGPAPGTTSRPPSHRMTNTMRRCCGPYRHGILPANAGPSSPADAAPHRATSRRSSVRRR